MRRLTILLLAFCPIAAHAAPSTAELAELFMPAEIERPKLSPDGKFLAFLARTGDTYTIGLTNLATGQTELSKSDAKTRPIDFWWKTPSRLLVEVSNVKLNDLSYAIFDLERKVTEDAWQLDRQPGRLFDAQPNDPKHVLMLNADEITRINLDNGNAETIDRSPARVSTWVLDSASRARALYRSNYQFGTADFWWRSQAGGEWRLQEFTATDRRFVPQAIDADGIRLWGWDLAASQETTFSSFNTQTGERTVKRFLPNLPPTHLLMLGKTRQPVAVAHAQGKDVYLFALAPHDNEAVGRLQAAFAGFFPVIIDALPDDKTWLVWIGNSRLPGAYFLFNHQTGEAAFLAQSYPKNLPEDRLAPAEYLTFPTRNGQTLTGRLWRPPGKSLPPLIVYCPQQLPADPAFDLYQPDVQAFVAQGFAVLKVNVRGTSGFGVLPESLDENSGTHIQEDLEDAVAALAEQKVTDSKRVYLYGTHFGGVLAVEIAARSNRFAAIATVNIPANVYRDDLFNHTDDNGVNSMTARLGGWGGAGRLARDLSPVRQVVNLKIPALYLHNEDSIKGQPIQSGREIRSAVKKLANARAGLAYGWTDRLKAPSKLAKENADISIQVGNFFNEFAAQTSQPKP